jgi:hypothetical protein
MWNQPVPDLHGTAVKPPYWSNEALEIVSGNIRLAICSAKSCPRSLELKVPALFGAKLIDVFLGPDRTEPPHQQTILNPQKTRTMRQILSNLSMV